MSVLDERIKWLAGTSDSSLEWLYDNGAIEGHASLKFRGLLAKSKKGAPAKRYLVREAEELEVADQTTGMKILGAGVWGTAGVLAAGPVGAVVGGVLGGRGETVTFAAKFRDGATMLAQVPKKTWIKIMADRF